MSKCSYIYIKISNLYSHPLTQFIVQTCVLKYHDTSQTEKNLIVIIVSFTSVLRCRSLVLRQRTRLTTDQECRRPVEGPQGPTESEDTGTIGTFLQGLRRVDISTGGQRGNSCLVKPTQCHEPLVFHVKDRWIKGFLPFEKKGNPKKTRTSPLSQREGPTPIKKIDPGSRWEGPWKDLSENRRKRYQKSERDV